MSDVPRITPEQVQEARRRTPELLLVCAYDDEEKCARMRIDGALTLAEFKARLVGLPKQVPLVFYCA